MRLPLLFILAVCGGIMPALAQPTTYKFDFGDRRPAKDNIQVPATARYSEATGYGFEFTPDSALRVVGARVNDALERDGVTCNRPYYFSMKLPEGNYSVTATVGRPGNPALTVIKAESRRLVAEYTSRGGNTLQAKHFVVNIKSPSIDGNTKVALKPREYDKLDWDNKLTLEFEAGVTIAGLEVHKVKDQITVFLAGNSTVVNQEYEPWASWGQMIPRFFKPGVVFANHAESGLSLASFQNSKRLQKILAVCKAGDYLFIEFGHNDQKEKGPDDGAYKSYTQRLKSYIAQAREKGMIPVVVTSTARRNYDSTTGKLANNLGDYPEAARKVAKDQDVALIDLNGMSIQLYQALGVEGSKKAFVFYPANTFPGQKDALQDNTHFNAYGAYQLARCVVEGVRNLKLGIARYIRDDIPVYDPARPDSVAKFYWPKSPRTQVQKPDGN